jgi:hypothetical protein
MNGKMILPLVMAALLAGCAAPRQSDVYTYRNDVGQGIDLIMDNEIESATDRSALLWLNASRIREGAWGGRYFLEVRYEALESTGWLDIGPGESLTLTVDDTIMKFSGLGSLNTRRKTADGTLVETAIYHTTENDLRKIAKAKTVQVTVRGGARMMEREFKPQNIEKFRKFVLSYFGF